MKNLGFCFLVSLFTLLSCGKIEDKNFKDQQDLLGPVKSAVIIRGQASKSNDNKRWEINMGAPEEQYNKKTYSFAQDGRLIEINNYNSYDDLVEQIIPEYKEDKIVKTTSFDSLKNVQSVWINTKFRGRIPIEKENYDKNMKLIGEVKITLNDKGNITNEIGSGFSVVTSTNVTDNITSIDTVKDNYTIGSEYDDHERLTKETYISNNDFSSIYQFEYLAFDAQGNWTERLVVNEIGHTKITFLELRYFTYYLENVKADPEHLAKLEDIKRKQALRLKIEALYKTAAIDPMPNPMGDQLHGLADKLAQKENLTSGNAQKALEDFYRSTDEALIEFQESLKKNNKKCYEAVVNDKDLRAYFNSLILSIDKNIQLEGLNFFSPKIKDAIIEELNAKI